MTDLTEENVDFSEFRKEFEDKIEAAKKEHGTSDPKELASLLPKQQSVKHGTIALTTIDGISLTNKGELTRNDFLKDLTVDREKKYGDIMLTREEAQSLASTYRHLSTGVNAVVPLRCAGDQCPFADDCWYAENGKAPIGKPCILEYDLMNFHTKKFIEEYDVDPTDHSDIMMIQELSELIIYESRATKILAKPANASMFGIKLNYDNEGRPIEEEVIHWAWELKEKIKNRRMKILEALMGTRKAKATIKNKEDDPNAASQNARLMEIKEKIDRLHKAQYSNSQEAQFKDVNNNKEEGDGTD